MAVHDLTGDWNGAFIEQAGNQVTIMPDWNKINPANTPWEIGTGILIGDSLRVEFSGGRAPAPVTYTGTVAPDGSRISHIPPDLVVKYSALHNSLEISMGYPFIYQKLGKAVE